MDKSNRFLGCLMGLAVGDAVGTSLEFKSKGSFTPITDMLGGGPFGLKPGYWTDDTSMALCLATSLLECGGFDAHDQMQRYCLWESKGYLSSIGRCFDIGNTVSDALENYKLTQNPYSGSTDYRAAGNGSLMRLAPVPMFYYPDIDQAEFYGANSSKITHGADEAVDACRLFSRQLVRALDGQTKEDILLGDSSNFEGSPNIVKIAEGHYRNKDESIIWGTGYVVQSLEAALWAFWNSDNFSDAILKAANLGDDADTTAAICGQIAGAYYGFKGIPDKWRKQIVMSDFIEKTAHNLGKLKQ